MSTDKWFAEFEREEAKRQDRLDQIREAKRPLIVEEALAISYARREAALIEVMHCA